MTRRFSAGGAVYKISKATTWWLVTRPRPSKDFPEERWVLPKGEINPGEKLEVAAIREVLEETGIKAGIKRKVDYGKSMYEVEGEKIFKITTYYLMEYEKGSPTENEEVAEVSWLTTEETKKRLSYSNEKRILQKALVLLNV